MEKIVGHEKFNIFHTKKLKFQNLRDALKNEIFSFLSLEEIFNTILSLNKTIFNLLKKDKIIKICLNKKPEILKNIDFIYKENITFLKTTFNCENKKILYDIFKYFILLKYRNQHQIDLSGKIFFNFRKRKH